MTEPCEPLSAAEIDVAEGYGGSLASPCHGEAIAYATGAWKFSRRALATIRALQAALREIGQRPCESIQVARAMRGSDPSRPDVAAELSCREETEDRDNWCGVCLAREALEEKRP